MLLMFEQKLKSMRKGITEEAKSIVLLVFIYSGGGKHPRYLFDGRT